MEISDHPLPTPPSIPPDSYDRISSSTLRGQSEDPLSVSPVLSHSAVVDAFTSDARDQSHSPNSLSPLFRSSHRVDIPQTDSSIDVARSRLESPDAMEMDEQPSTSGMVNGHKENGDYTMEDIFSGPAVESLEPTNEPTPPSTEQPVESTSFPPPSMVSGGEKAPPSLLETPGQHPTQRSPISQLSAKPPTASISNTKADVMEDVLTFKAPTKPTREPPTTSDEPPAKRLKTEPSEPSYDTSKKIPANQQKFLTALLRQVKKGKDATPFREPVDPIKLNIPLYFDIVTRPMDISTIEKKLVTGAYPVVQAVVDDFNLMIDNCVKFNGLENPVTRMGKNIQATFEKGMKTLPPEQVFSSFEPI
jgi:hypothetical protein